MSEARRWGLFDVVGVELEYMIVGQESLDVLPVSDQVLAAAAGELTSDVDRGMISWSNELVLHVLEFKTTEPVARLDQAVAEFQQQVDDANALLEPLGGMLLPSAMHPWMDPHQEMKLWPHDNNAIYEAFHRIFDCRGHGWANLQSMHLNLPFRDDEEFGRLHAAIRLILPLLPGLAASSPLVESRISSHLDTRLQVYRKNAHRVPEVSGKVVPEAVYTEADYDREILKPMYRAIAPADPDKILQHIWLNARGAIARFDRGSIEIRVLDVQECPAADLAIASLIVETLKALCNERWTPTGQQRVVPTDVLANLLSESSRLGPEAFVPALVTDHFGCSESRGLTVGQLWNNVLLQLDGHGKVLDGDLRDRLEIILRQGTLAQRILAALEGNCSHKNLMRVYRQLAGCLRKGTMFVVE